MEWQYSDDCDFNDEDEAALKELEKQAKITLAEWNLTVNKSKTEYVKFYVAAKKEKDHKNKPLHKDEPWRSNKLLGSLLCSKKDIASRCIKGDIAFRKFEKVWLTGEKITLGRRLRLYEAQVVSVMMYNSNSWCATDVALNKLDVTHRTVSTYGEYLTSDGLEVKSVTKICTRDVMSNFYQSELLSIDGRC